MSLREQVIKIHAENDSAKEYAQLKAKLYGLNSQLDALAERIAILPKVVSPGPLFKQMEKIETRKIEIEERLLKTNEVNLNHRLVPMETFSKFAEIVKKSLSENPDMDAKKMILQKFVRRVEIGSDRVKIFWNVDKEFYSNEVSQALACGSSSKIGLLNFSWNVGSNSLTNGAQLEQVDEHPTGGCATFIFEMENYPDPKVLSRADLMALYDNLKSYRKVAALIGASETFVRHSCQAKKYKHTK